MWGPETGARNSFNLIYLEVLEIRSKYPMNGWLNELSRGSIKRTLDNTNIHAEV